MNDTRTEKIEIEVASRPQKEACANCGLFPPRALFALTRETPEEPFVVQVASQDLKGWTDRTSYDSGNSTTVERLCPNCRGA